jgi:hypothetical protein
MAGALSRQRFADGGQAQPFTSGDYALATDPNAANNPYVAATAGGALSQDNTAANDLVDYGRDLRGSSPALDYQALKGERDRAAGQKIAAINQAMGILQAARAGQASNLPMLAAAGGILSPTRTGSLAESLGAGFRAAVPVTEEERRQQWQQASAMGNLGVAASEVPLQTSQQDISDWNARMQRAEQALATAAIVGGRVQTATIGAQAREDVAQKAADAKIQAAIIQGNARIGWAEINAQKGQWEYEGLDPNNQGQGVYLNKNWGTVNFGPAIDPKKNVGADPARIREANILVQKGVAPDFNKAYSMVRAGVNDANTFDRLVQAEKNTIRQEMRYQGASDEELEARARKNIVERTKSRQEPAATPAAASPPPAAASPPAAAPPPAAPSGTQNQPAAAAPPVAKPPVKIGTKVKNKLTGERRILTDKGWETIQ